MITSAEEVDCDARVIKDVGSSSGVEIVLVARFEDEGFVGSGTEHDTVANNPNMMPATNRNLRYLIVSSQETQNIDDEDTEASD